MKTSLVNTNKLHTHVITTKTKFLTLLVVFLASFGWGQTTLISPTGDGGFENGSTFAANGWTTVNPSTDQWSIGSVPVVSAGTNCAYVSSNGGVAWTYSQLSIYNHMYRDVTIPSGETKITLSFKWKATGEGTTISDWDNLKIFWGATSITPTNTTAVSGATQLSGPGAISGMYKLSSTSWNSETITFTAAPGTYRLFFQWKSDNADIVNPPAALDEISLVSAVPVAANAPITFTTSAVTSAGMTINWVDNSTNESVFKVYRSTDNVTFTQVGSNISSTTVATTGTVYNQVQTGLLPNTTYYYRISALYDLESSFLTGSQTTNLPGTFISATTGNFGTAATWDLNSVPTPNDNIEIASGHTVTIDASSQSATNVVVKGTLTYASSPSSFAVNGNLTVDAGGVVNVFNATTGKTLTVAGNITNNGTMDFTVGGTASATTGASLLTLNGTAVQTVSGTGTFLNNKIGSLTCSNTSTATPNIIWQFDNILIQHVLNLTGARFDNGTRTLSHGSSFNTSTASISLITSAGCGFMPGAKYRRWFTTGATGGAISAGADPTAASSRFPFVNATGTNQRWVHIQRSSSSPSGNTAGYLAVKYNDATTATTGLSIAESSPAYTITNRYDANWTITAESGYVYASGTHNIAIVANNVFYASNGNSRLMLASAPLAGTHQNGTITPGAQRIGLTTAQLTAGDIYMGINAADIPFVSVANGDWNNPATWGVGSVPTCTGNVAIMNGHNVTVNSASNVSRNLTVNTGGTLTVASGDLTVGCTLNNTPLTNNGTLTVSGGTLNVNGNIVSNLGSTFNQSGGNINIDGNAAGNATNSVASATALLQFNQLNSGINLTGGTLTIVDPHANSTSSNSIAVINATTGTQTSTVNHTLRLGDGISTDAGGNIVGFRIDPWNSNAFLSFGNIIVNGSTGTNRLVTSAYQLAAIGDVTVTSGSTLNLTSTLIVAGNLNVNSGGTLVNTAGIAAALVASNTNSSLVFGPSTNAQTIGGSGTYQNAATAPTANLTAFSINNSNSTGVTLNIPLSISGTLTMTAGKINTTATNLLTLGTTSAAGTLSYTAGQITGPFARTFAASRTASGTYDATTLFPVGKGTAYTPIWIDPTTTNGGAVIMTGEVFSSNSGSAASGVSNLSTNSWTALPTTGSANFTSARIRLTDASVTTSSSLLQASSASGAYNGIDGGSTSSGAAGNVTSLAAVVPFSGYFAYGNQTYTWTGSTSTAWSTASNWNPAAVPTSTDNVIITATGTPNFPPVATSLTIANGATMTLNSNARLTVNGILSNNGTLTLESGATLVQDGSGTVAGSGTFNVKQALTGAGGATPSGRFWYLGSPVSGATSNVFNAAGDNRLWTHSEANLAYTEIFANNVSMAPLNGHVVRLGANETSIFTGGMLNTGNYTNSTLTNSGTGSANGYTLVSNPYPSYLNWDDAFAGATGINSSIWYRSHNSTSNTMVFDIYNATGAVATSNAGVTIDKYIPPMQAFWVYNPTNGTSGMLTFSNSMRSHQSNGGLKSTTDFPAFVRLNLENDGAIDQTVLYFDNNAAAGYDNFDSDKMMLANMAQVYSFVDNKKLAINGMKSMKANKQVPLTVEFPTAKSYSFNATEVAMIEGIVLLEDRLTKVFQDLTMNPVYEFEAAAGTAADRFVVHFQANGGVAGIETAEDNGIAIVSNATGLVTITLSEELPAVGTIQIIDANGKVIATQAINEQATTMNINAATGIYHVLVDTSSKIARKKIVITK